MGGLFIIVSRHWEALGSPMGSYAKLWEALADGKNLWKQQVSQGLKSGEAAIGVKNDARRTTRITCHQQQQPDPIPASAFMCQGCSTARLRI